LSACIDEFLGDYPTHVVAVGGDWVGCGGNSGSDGGGRIRWFLSPETFVADDMSASGTTFTTPPLDSDVA
jgi:hypothetical protein